MFNTLASGVPLIRSSKRRIQMKRRVIHLSKWTRSTVLLLILVLVGCTGQVPPPTAAPVASPTTGSSSPTQEPAAPPTEPGVESTPASQPSPDANILYQDDFTNLASGWPSADFGDYFIGYHEPEYYHIEIKTPNAKAPVVSIPESETNSFPDATIELVVSTVSGRTATDGDYRYGLAFRRRGDNYYAFTVSPTTKMWQVLKSSPTGVVVLKEGVLESINDLDVDDILRVDAQGSNFLFTINDVLVGQISDPDYADGEIGLYMENLSNTNTHVHYNELTVRSVRFALMCSINEGGTVNVRNGPGQANSTIGVLSSGDTVRALGRSSNNWIQVVIEGSDTPGWVSYGEGYMTCTPSIDLFPIINP
jgi:hypothetical protein